MASEWIAPVAAGVLALATAITGGLIAIRNTRSGAVENRAPSTTQAWSETNRARARMYAFEDLFWTVLAALKHLHRDVKSAHPDFVISDDVAEALEIKPPEDEPK